MYRLNLLIFLVISSCGKSNQIDIKPDYDIRYYKWILEDTLLAYERRVYEKRKDTLVEYITTIDNKGTIQRKLRNQFLMGKNIRLIFNDKALNYFEEGQCIETRLEDFSDLMICDVDSSVKNYHYSIAEQELDGMSLNVYRNAEFHLDSIDVIAGGEVDKIVKILKVPNEFIIDSIDFKHVNQSHGTL